MQNKNKITPYQTKSELLSGTSLEELNKKARIVYRTLQKRTKRNPYIRSAYFSKQKIFFDYFWRHLIDLQERQKIRNCFMFRLRKIKSEVKNI